MGAKFYSLQHIFLTVVILSLFGCKNTKNQIAVIHIQPVAFQGQVPLLIPVDSCKAAFNGLERKTSVVKYYQESGGNPFWIQNGKCSVLADSMIYILQNVQYYGFPNGSYHLVELENARENFTEEGLIRKELLLTDAFFSLSKSLKYGIRNPQSESDDSLQIELLNAVVKKGNLKNALETQEPTFMGYTSLKEGLRLMLDSARTESVDSTFLEESIRLISINLERWRAENANISGRYIFINIPSYMLDVVEHDSTVLSSKVIVGTPETETPVLSSVVQCFSTYPYWHVPRKISIQEYLPVIKMDSTFIRRNNFDVLDRKGNILNPDSVEWDKFHENYFPVGLRQREGPENSLGVIKFIFDNPYAVFLHDTNAKRLFKNKARAFSHGCIRMEKAVELAHYLVTGLVGKESKSVSKYLKEKQQNRVDLKNPIPIHIRYFTCEFKHSTFFRYEDVYAKDKLLYELLFHDADSLHL